MAVRLALFSDDRELQKKLSAALGEVAEIFLEYTEAGVRRLLESGACEGCIIHLTSNRESMHARREFARRMIASQAEVFVAADKGLEWSAAEMVHLGAKGYFRNDGMFRTLNELLLGTSWRAKSALCREVADLSEYARGGGLIGTSPLIEHVSQLIRLVADLDVPVFIGGETGTGKELIARAIHNSGTRVDKPFVAVSCGAIPETLLEEELFGHEKGAFTGSVGPRPGALEESANGTLFFDEIGELSAASQVKLLRVLQEREFKRLGSNRLIPLRARLIFATHQNLEERVAQGLFRQDLYYRLDVIRINAPPLRDRPEDLSLLVEHFLQMYARKLGLPLPEIEPDTMMILRNYSWPGNVRELEHVIESSLIVSRGEPIGPHHLPERFVQNTANIVDIGSYLRDGSFDEQLSNFKLKLALAAVRQHNGNKTLAARSLNISRPYLHRLLRLSGSDQVENTDCSELEAM